MHRFGAARVRRRHRRLPSGEEHWHGAAANNFLSHLAMLESLPGGEDPTTWLEPVPDDEYQQANGR